MIGAKPKRKLCPVRIKSVNTLVSWIRNEVELSTWSGNTFRKGFSRKRMQEHLKRKDLHSFAQLDDEGNLLCYADIVQGKERTAILCRVIVRPNRRGKGLGKAFCEDLLTWAKEKGGYRKVHLNTFGRNTAAMSCYKALGFRPLFVKPKCRKVGDEWQDLVIMSLDLPSFDPARKK